MTRDINRRNEHAQLNVVQTDADEWTFIFVSNNHHGFNILHVPSFQQREHGCGPKNLAQHQTKNQGTKTTHFGLI